MIWSGSSSAAAYQHQPALGVGVEHLGETAGLDWHSQEPDPGLGLG